MLEICFEGGLKVNNDLKKNVAYGSLLLHITLLMCYLDNAQG